MLRQEGKHSLIGRFSTMADVLMFILVTPPLCMYKYILYPMINLSPTMISNEWLAGCGLYQSGTGPALERARHPGLAWVLAWAPAHRPSG